MPLLPLIAYSFVMAITPGPNNLLLAASGARFGFVRTLPALLGIQSGFIVLALACIAGLGAVFERWPVLLEILQWVGAAYLAWLAWRMLRAAGPGEARDGEPVGFLAGALFQVVNPKAWVMSITSASLVLSIVASPAAAAATLVAVCVCVNLPCIAVWAAFGSGMRRFLGSPSRLRAFNGTMAVALALTGIGMLV